MVTCIHPLNFVKIALEKKVKMHGNIILHPNFHQVLDPCLNIPENMKLFMFVCERHVKDV